jgi:polysaccharide biosynthesis transport protein
MSALIANPAVRSILRGLLVWSPLWISTTILFGGIGVAYVLFIKQDTYLASQALLVRDEATGAVMRLGRFQSQAEMKAAQETILEMAKSQAVVRDALAEVGPTSGLSSWLNWGDYPSKELIEETARSGILVHAPKGTEFGVTEVIYMDVKANSQEEALALNKALANSLESRLQQVRKARADGVLAELTHARDSAQQELANSTHRLREMENAAGSDLSDLRGMTEMVAGSANSRVELDQTKTELRQATINRETLIADREMLIRATKDPTSFIVAPGTVLNSQPGLKRLREGLVDAQLSGSQLAGKFTDFHPSVVASYSAQSSIVKRFVQELTASIAGVQSDIALVDARIERLENQKKSAEDRLAKLADSRSAYANLLSEVKSKVSNFEAAERALAEVRAARDSSVSTSLLTRLDAPIVSDRPVGPGKTMICTMCTVAGLVFGLGIVFLVTPIDASPAFGRRSQDRALGRRDADVVNRVEPAGSSLSSTSQTDEAIDQLLEFSSERPAQTSGWPQKTSIPNESTKPERSPRRVNSTSSITNPVSTPIVDTASVAELDSLEGYQPLIKPRPTESVKKQKETAANLVRQSENRDVDYAFQELSRLQARRPESRSEELSVQREIQELKGVLSKLETPRR